MKLAAHYSQGICIVVLWIILCGSLLLGCATSFVTNGQKGGQKDGPRGAQDIEQNFLLLAPASIEQPVTVLMKIDSNQAGVRYHWEAVLNVDAKQIKLIILSTLGRRLATFSFDGQKITAEHDNSIDISIKKFLGQLQMIFWPLSALNTDKLNENWHFVAQNRTRNVYYKKIWVAEIHRRGTSLWNGDFNYVSRISDDQITIQSSQMDQ